MIAIPLPFVVALLLWILLIHLLVDREEDSQGERAALVFVGTCATAITVIGLRWSMGEVLLFRFLLMGVGAMVPPIAWFCFSPLAHPVDPGTGSTGSRAGRWVHGLPIVLVIGLMVLRPVWYLSPDLILATQYLAYGVALARIGIKGPDSLGAARLTDAVAVRWGILVAAMVLMSNTAVEIAIALDFKLSGGRHAPDIVAGANGIGLVLIALSATLVRRSRPTEASAPAGEPVSAAAVTLEGEPDDQEVLDLVDRVLLHRGLYKNPDLTVNRLARATGLPARRLSAAINRLHGENLSRFVNGYRIREAQRLLRETEEPVTSILFDCGFQTKSNFNREFLRIMGRSPSAYRKSLSTVTEGPPLGREAPAR
ncbi:MAG: AraC family transcriptional regulator [Rhodospirillum sp.]|nr:AraC family transcriptional regulator [Rhodospirillum sp.]MCF8490296.1 AraC family transcriptional regulator [Rhodospirillum sp.]MCF8499334.1 AraC family transcriptional regulator [Rhodospirillum sp.]